MFKLTPQVRKQLKEVESTLPQIPYITDQGKILNKATSKLVSGKELKKTTPKLSNGDKIYDSNTYVQHGRKLVMTNHMVNLREWYKRYGSDGVEAYIQRVNFINKQIEEQTKK